MLTAQYVRSILSYDEETGQFSYRKRRGYRSAGRICGTVKSTGYVAITINRISYMAHRLAWLYVRGEWPDGFIDHINAIKTDNRISNLRIATPSQNNANQPLSSRNSSGFKGVTWHKLRGKWQAAIRVGGKNIHLGLFESPEIAHAAYMSAAKEHYGNFARAS